MRPIISYNPIISKRFTKWTNFLVHAIVLCLLFIFPELLVPFLSPEFDSVPVAIYFKTFICVAIFYANYYVIIDRTLLPSIHLTRFMLFNSVIILLALVILYAVWTLSDPVAHGVPMSTTQAPVGSPALINVARDVIIIILTVGLAVAVRLSYHWLQIDRNNRELETLHKDLELSQLRDQLNPHFIFNVLNTIYALIEIDPGKARDAVHRLSKMLRYMLTDPASTVELSRECNFITDYISLMKLRLPVGFPLTVRIDCREMAHSNIRPLIFINVIENAFKYTLLSSGQRFIHISLTTRGRSLVLHCANAYTPQTADPDDNHRSIGLQNLRRRLQLRYPEAHTLTIDDSGHTFTVDLTIDLTQ
ncbi:MAG: histidine kinase [Bacteroides sp.]|nr:histidine kinase [Bacteroides sp.]MCM1412997.1 histidine kinase [Bacteroides sp.]MCM1471703.1 histidine kinase [Bacteroides sp.]